MTITPNAYPHDDPEVVAALKREAEWFGTMNQGNASSIREQVFGRSIMVVTGPDTYEPPRPEDPINQVTVED